MKWEEEVADEWEWNGEVEEEEEESGFIRFNEEKLEADDESGFPSPTPAEDEDSFASHFYRCGTDWSALSSSSPCAGSSKRLKQTSLLHLWGFPSPSSSSSHSNPSHIAPTVPSLPLNNNIKDNNKKRSKNALFFPNSPQQPPRPCPFYKKIPGTNFTVDAFRYGSIKACSAYFLTHFHADHYGGLNKRWSHGPIYCTPLTARLVKMCLSVNQSFLRPLELDTEYVIEGIKVTMLEANHCPGAALILFRLLNGQCVLHTGDFRVSKQMQAYPLLRNQHVNVLYLDTTYCNPKYRFPAKEAVLNFVARITKGWLQKQPKALIVVGAYSIGKESVYLAIANELKVKELVFSHVKEPCFNVDLHDISNYRAVCDIVLRPWVKIYASTSRRRILQSFGWPEICGNLSTNGKDTPLHVLPISSLKIEVLERYLKTYRGHYTSVLAFRPTGWTYSDSVGNNLDLIKPKSVGAITIYGVPYSEHSSFSELQEFIQFLRPERIIPTVNVGNAANRDKMQSYFREWLKDE